MKYEKQLARIDSVVQESPAGGATLAAGGTADALFYRPTVLAVLDRENRGWTEEIFGPVAPVMSYFGGASANIEAFTENQWLTVRPDIAIYLF